MSEPLNHRARKILAAVVQEYLATGDAVGSRTVTRRHGIDLSPATVRNVMSDLEEAGLLAPDEATALEGALREVRVTSRCFCPLHLEEQWAPSATGHRHSIQLKLLSLNYYHCFS